jgi:hypothetical protein
MNDCKEAQRAEQCTLCSFNPGCSHQQMAAAAGRSGVSLSVASCCQPGSHHQQSSACAANIADVVSRKHRSAVAVGKRPAAGFRPRYSRVLAHVDSNWLPHSTNSSVGCQCSSACVYPCMNAHTLHQLVFPQGQHNGQAVNKLTPFSSGPAGGPAAAFSCCCAL